MITRRIFLAQASAAGVSLCQSLSASLDPLNGLRKNHPRLVLLDSDLGLIRGLVREHPLARKIHSDLAREADKLMQVPPVEYKLAGNRLMIQNRRVVDRIYTLSLLYRLHAQPQYLDRALRELRAMSSFPNWNPQHFLDVAEMAHAFAIGYDWLYPALTPEEQGTMRATLIEKALDPALPAYAAADSWAFATSNSNIVCNAGIGMAALAVASEEPDLSARILRSVFASLPRALASYAPDGAWADGPAHWNFATRYLTTLLSALESALDNDAGLSHVKGLEHTGRFRIYLTGPASKAFNFADSTDDVGTAPEMFWLARRFDEPVFAWEEQKDADRATHPDPVDLIWFYKDARPPEAENWPLDALFAGVQVATMRSAWDDPEAIFLGVKGGDNKAAHTHLDLGSFVLDAGGVRWAYDPGAEDSDAGNAGKPRLPSFRSRTEAHNTLLIDEENQDRRAEGHITHHEFSSDLAWVQIDLRGAYPGKLRQWQRRIGLASRQAILIQDTVEADQPIDVLWGMMADADVTVNGQMAELQKSGWTLSVEIRTPRHAVFEIITNAAGKKLVARVGPKISSLDLNIILIPYKTGRQKPTITAQFPV